MSDLAAVLARLDKITRGEWRVCSDETVTVRDARDGSIASLGWLTDRLTGPRRSSTEVHANARAIALVPELIAVAKAAAELRSHQATEDAFSAEYWHEEERKKFAALDAALSALANRGME